MLVVGTRVKSSIPGHEWERDTRGLDIYTNFERWLGVEVALEAKI